MPCPAPFSAPPSRTWSNGYQNSVLELPNIRKLQAKGVSFERHYANAPVCCPSRATFWSGRHAHNIPHTHNGMLRRGQFARIKAVMYTPQADQRGYAAALLASCWRT